MKTLGGLGINQQTSATNLNKLDQADSAGVGYSTIGPIDNNKPSLLKSPNILN
jgi:hypothetical protein